jgi:predicted Zn-dependent protease
MSKYFSLVAILAVALLLGGCKKAEKPADAPKTDSVTTQTETPVSGETFTNEAAKVSIALPEGWYYEADETSMIAHSADSSLAVNFIILKAEELDAAMAEVDKSLAADVKNLKMGEAKDEEINGMKGRYIEGTADGLEVYMGLIDTPVANTTLFINAFAAPEALKKYEKELEYIFKNIKPVK